MVKIVNLLGDVKIGRQGEVVYQRKYGEQIRRMAQPKRAIPSQAQEKHRQKYRDALAWRKQLSLPNRRYLDGYCIANWIVDNYKIPLPWSRFALKLYLQAIEFVPDLAVTQEPPLAAEKRESHYGSRLADSSIGQVNWWTQTFDASDNYKIGLVKLLLYRVGSPNEVTIGIRLTDGAGKPTGGDLTSGTTNGDTLTTNNTGEWREIELTPYQLDVGVRYAIVARAPGAAATNSLRWIMTRDLPRYQYGQMYYSGDSGGTWAFQNYDANFEGWSAQQEGEYTKGGILHVRHPALLVVIHKRGELIIFKYEALSSLDEEYITSQVGLDVEVGDIIKATTLPGIEYAYKVV